MFRKIPLFLFACLMCATESGPLYAQWVPTINDETNDGESSTNCDGCFVQVNVPCENVAILESVCGPWLQNGNEVQCTPWYGDDFTNNQIYRAITGLNNGKDCKSNFTNGKVVCSERFNCKAEFREGPGGGGAIVCVTFGNPIELGEWFHEGVYGDACNDGDPEPPGHPPTPPDMGGGEAGGGVGG